jgi:hypothetical protein
LFFILIGAVLANENPTTDLKPKINYKFVFFPEECFEKFFVSFNFLDIKCLV